FYGFLSSSSPLLNESQRTLVAKFPYHAVPTVGKANRQFNFNAGGGQQSSRQSPIPSPHLLPEQREFLKRSLAMNRLLNRVASHHVLANSSARRKCLELSRGVSMSSPAT